MSDAVKDAASEAKEKAEKATESGKGFFSKAGEAIKAGGNAVGTFFFGTKARGFATAVGAAAVGVGVYAHRNGDMPYQQDHDHDTIEVDMTGLIGD